MLSGVLNEKDALIVIILSEPHSDIVLFRRVHFQPHVVRRYGKLAVAAINQHREFDRLRSTVVSQSINGSFDSPPCEKNIIKENDVRVVDRERNIRSLQCRHIPHVIEIISVNRDGRLRRGM